MTVTGYTVLMIYDEEKRMVRADFIDPEGKIEGRRWYPSNMNGEDVVWLDVANWTANNGIACSGNPGTINEGICDFPLMLRSGPISLHSSCAPK